MSGCVSFDCYYISIVWSTDLKKNRNKVQDELKNPDSLGLKIITIKYSREEYFKLYSAKYKERE